MSAKPYRSIAIVIAVAALAAAGGYWSARQQETSRATRQPGAVERERKVLYWYDPMVPNQHFDKPGKSPFMDMELVPKYADEEDAGAAALRIDPGVIQNLGVRLTTVEQGSFSPAIDAVGGIGFNQRDVAVVQARTDGFVARAYARAPGDVLQQGAPLVDLLTPGWASAQEEFVALLKSGDHGLIDAARERLRVLGIPAQLIARIEASRKAEPTVTIRAPIAGVIESLEAREGRAVGAGSTLATLNGLERVWLEVAIPEAQGGWTTIGKTAEVRLTAFPGEAFKGKVIAVLPQANAETRTLRVRIELPNPAMRLRPGMFAQARLEGGEPESVLLVASEAVIRTGTRSIVFVAGEDGRFTPTEVQTGAEADGKTVILGGLSAGQKVVSSGQFLIDSEASLKGLLPRMSSAEPVEKTETHKGHHP